LAQESYARVLAVQQSGETITEPRALLYRTARNLVIDQYRRSEVRNTYAAAEGDSSIDAADLASGPEALEPEVAAMSSQTVDALLAAIGELPLRCREAFILHKFDGLSQAEVAADGYLRHHGGAPHQAGHAGLPSLPGTNAGRRNIPLSRAATQERR
jgi:RNA polymerase sigma-70 factor (ECF subfamily)